MAKPKFYKATKDFLGFTPEVPLFEHAVIKMLLERHKDDFENALVEVWVDEKEPEMYIIRIQDGPPSPAWPKEEKMDSNTPEYLPMAASEDEALALQLKALKIVRHYVQSKLDKSDPEAKFQVFPVWFSKTLQNWKMLVSTTLNDQMYYEVTYNGSFGETYLDAYKKWENVKYLDGWDETGV